jgi:ATP synthase subunit 6
MINSTFEQFEIVRLIPFHPFGNLDLSFTNSTLFLFIALILINSLIQNNVKKGYIIPGRWQSVIELIFETVYNMIKDNIGSVGAKYFPFIFTLFMLIATLNIVGIVPYTFSPTAHIAITFGMSLSIWLACTILGFKIYGSDYLSMFMPSGSPIGLAPFLVIIEIVSYVAKAITLGVRLAANLTAGHLLFAILAGFTWKMLIAGGLISILSIFPMLIVIFITILEIGVALIQAYVFSLLTIIFLNDAVHLH